MSEYDQLPIEPLLKRWEKLPVSIRPFVHGYFAAAVRDLESGIRIAEEFAAKEAAEKAAAVKRSKNARLRVIKSA